MNNKFYYEVNTIDQFIIDKTSGVNFAKVNYDDLTGFKEKDLIAYLKRYVENAKEIKSLKFVMLFDAYFFKTKNYQTKLNEIFKICKEYGVEPQQLVVSISEFSTKLKNKDWPRIKEVNDFCQNKNIKFGFESLDKTWSIKEVENANKNIDFYAQKIREKNFSSFEKLLWAYSIVTNKKYKSEEIDEHYSQSRSVYGVLNSDKIVCVGFTKLLHSLINDLKDENIKIFENEVGCSINGEQIISTHRNAIVYIKDEKYNIDGYYYLDPTWDCRLDKSLPRYNYFMVPLTEIKNIKIKFIKDINTPILKNTEYDLRLKKANSVKVFNGVYERSLQFSGDKFGFNFPFLNHFLKNNSDIVKLLKDLIKSEDLFDEDDLELSHIREPIEELTILHLSEIIMKSKPLQKVVEMAVKDKSPVVDINNTALALKNCYKKLTSSNEKQINKTVDAIIKGNIQVSIKNFDKNSKHSIVEHYNTNNELIK